MKHSNPLRIRMFFSFKEIVCVGNVRIFKKLERNIRGKVQKKKFFKKNSMKGFTFFKNVVY